MNFQASRLSCLFALTILLALENHVESSSPAITVAPINSSGTSTAGDSYCLECTVTVTGSTDQPNITWLVDRDDVASEIPTTSVTVTVQVSPSTRRNDSATAASSIYSSRLMFNPLAASHAGTYTCRATLNSAMNSTFATIDITVQSES